MQSQLISRNVLTRTGEVCGLRWSPEGRYLATGGNDNRVAVWAQNALSSSDPMFVINEHQVRAFGSIYDSLLMRP